MKCKSYSYRNTVAYLLVGAMGVPPTSGKNCSKFDHITMARMAEQRLNNL